MSTQESKRARTRTHTRARRTSCETVCLQLILLYDKANWFGKLDSMQPAINCSVTPFLSTTYGGDRDRQDAWSNTTELAHTAETDNEAYYWLILQKLTVGHVS
jgi:hypothetical protein